METATIKKAEIKIDGRRVIAQLVLSGRGWGVCLSIPMHGDNLYSLLRVAGVSDWANVEGAQVQIRSLRLGQEVRQIFHSCGAGVSLEW